MKKTVFAIAFLGITIILTFACKKDKPVHSVVSNPTNFTDPRDGQSYAVVQIGNQFWMAENLNYVVGNSWCYNNNPSYCDTYGRLYDWHTAQMACPPGWHLPSDSEWTELVNFLGGAEVAGGKMKDTTSWYAPNAGASNSSAFSGLAGGLHNIDGASYTIGDYGYWWSSSKYDTYFAWSRYLYYDGAFVGRGDYRKTVGLSCRCLRD